MRQQSLFHEVEHGETWETMRDKGALFILNHSGGKDSQAMYERVRHLIPRRQLIVVHSILHEADWGGIPEHVEATVSHPVYYVAAAKSFFDMVEARGMFPSPQQRQCTSDLKRTPIDTFTRRFLKEHPEYGGRVVHVVGLRAEESHERAKASTWERYKRESIAGREVYHWLPIHDLSEREVFQTIADAGQKPHWAYSKGMTRLSCCFCIMASRADLQTAANLRPDLYERYVRLERKINFTMSMEKKPLDRIVGKAVEEVSG